MLGLDRYKEQWQGLQQVLNLLDERYSRVPMLRRRKTIVHLIRNLQQFADGQFNFFFEGFKSGNLTPSAEFPAEHVLETIISQISEDINLIQRAATQRREFFVSPLFSNVPTRNASGAVRAVASLPELLGKADDLASYALWDKDWPLPGTLVDPYIQEPFHAGKGECEAINDFRVKTVLTYFQKSIEVRVLPYTQVALIGIPYAGIFDLQTFLALPHEVGHFRYWYGFRQAGGELLNARELHYPYPAGGVAALGAAPPWSEEIFADVYAAWMGGPLAALAAQDMAEEHSALGFGDPSRRDEHFYPYMRPLILIKAIANFDNTLLNGGVAPAQAVVAQQLFARWQARLGARGVTVPAAGSTVDGLITFNTALSGDPVDVMINHALGVLKQINNGLPRDWGWSGAFPAIAALEADVNNRVRNLFLTASSSNWQIHENALELPFSWAPAAGATPPTWANWAVKKGYAPFTIAPPIPAGSYADIGARTANRWIRVFGAGGWTTEGPCAFPPP